MRRSALTVLLVWAAQVLADTPSDPRLVTECFDKRLSAVVDLYTNNETCKTTVNQFMRFTGPDTTEANCGEQQLLIACFLDKKDQWLEAAKDCDELWTLAPCVVDFSTASFSDVLSRRCNQQTLELVEKTTAAGSLCRTTLTAAVQAKTAKQCPAEAIVQQCFKNDTSVREQWTTLLVGECPTAFENSACLNAFNVITWNTWLDAKLGKASLKSPTSAAAWLPPLSPVLLIATAAAALWLW